MTIFYGSAVADATLTTACDLSTVTGGVETSKTTSVTGGNHFCEIYSQGGSQTSQTSIGAPSGKGWVSAPLPAGTFATGNWSFVHTFAFGSWQTGNTVTCRAYRLSGGVYTSIGTDVVTITTTAKTTYSFSPTSFSSIAFAAGDQVYHDAFLTDTSGTGGDNPVVYLSNSASMGVVNDCQITTSTFTPSAGAVKKDIAWLGRLSATAQKDIAWFAKLALGGQKDIAWLGKISAPPAQIGIAIANTAAIIDETTFQLHYKLDERQRFQVTVEDYPGTASYSRGQNITVDDPTLGRLFSGVVVDDLMDKSKVFPDSTIEHQIDTVGNEYFADKRVSSRFYTSPAYASSIVFDAVADALAAEGVVAKYARRVDTTSTDWGQGTLSSTNATTNVGDGDLELVSNGPAVTTSYASATDWNTGTFTNMVVNAGGDISLSGATRNWDNGDTSNQTLFGNGNPTDGTSGKQYFLTCAAKSATISRLDFAGSWANATVEVDMVLANDTARRSFTVRQTTWNSNDDYAYAIELRTASIEFRIGNNGAGGATHQLAIHNFSSNLSAGSYRVRLVMNGSSFTVSLNGAQYLSVSDSTYSAAGMIALRNRNDTTTASLTDYFDNFGVMATLSGTWQSAATSINAVTTVGSSVITWDQGLSQGGTILIQTSIDGGSSFQTCSNGGIIPGLPAGSSGTGKTVIVKISLSTTTTATMPDIRSLQWSVVGGYVSSGTRISPVLALAPAGRIGSTYVAWNVNLPSSATTLGVDTSLDGGVTWVDVTNNNGGAIPGLVTQPEPTIDGFDSNTIANYVLVNGFNGSPATWAYDTSHSRLLATNGASSILANSTLIQSNVDMFADLDLSDAGGIAFGYSGQTSYYGVIVADNQASVGTKNTLTFYRTQAYQMTILADSPLNYYRLNESAGTSIADLSGNGRTATASSGGLTYSSTGLLSGDTDTAILFDGSTGSIQLPTTGLPSGAAQWTLECWCVLSKIPATQYHTMLAMGFPSNQQSAQIKISSNGTTAQFLVSTYFGDITSASNIVVGTPYHVVGTYDGTNIRLYVNGALAAGPQAESMNVVLNSAWIGASGTNAATAQEWFGGVIDEAAIYGTALSAGKILAHYNAGIGGSVTQISQVSIPSFVRTTWHRLRATNIDGTITISWDGVQKISYTDPNPLPAGLAGLYNTGGYTTNWATRPFMGTIDLGITGGFTTLARFYQLWIQPIGDNAVGKSVMTRCRLATTDSTVTPQVLDLTVSVNSPNVNIGTLIPSADYRMKFISKVFDDLAKQSNYAWWIDATKTLNFRHRSAVPSPWILQTNTLGLASDIEQDTNLNVTIANDLFRNRQNLTGVLNVGSFTANFQGDGQTTSFTLQFPVAPGTVPTITLNAVTQKVQKKGTTGAQFYYADSDAVIAQDTSLVKLTSSDRLIVTYTGIFTTTVTVDNTSSQASLALVENGTGIVEAVEDVANRNMMYAAAQTYASQLLLRYCISGRTLSFNTLRNGLAVGQILSVFIPEEGIYDVQMLIQTIDITVMRTQPGSTILYYYTVVASELPNQGSWQKLLTSSILLT